MLTEVYNKKISKFISFYKFLYRFRVLIITTFVLIAAIAGTLMSLDGFVIKDIEVINPVYGTDYNFEATSLFSNENEIEYHDLKNDTWSNIKPKDVGDYEARTITKNIFDNEVRGLAHPFTIEPRSVKPILEKSTITYGDTPSIDIDGLAEGDKIAKIDYDIKDITSENPYVAFKENGIAIQNEEGVDVTYNYNVDYSNLALKVNPRSLRYRVDDIIEYDGLDHAASDSFRITSSELIEGDHIQFTKTNSIKDVGYINGDVEFRILSDKYQADVTKLYSFSKPSSSNSEIRVNERHVSFDFEPIEKVYDGKYIDLNEVCNPIASSGSLAAGHTIEFTFEDSYKDVTDGAIEVAPTRFIVRDASGVDVTPNYSIDVSPLTLEITPRPIEVKVIDRSEVYNSSSYSIDPASEKAYDLASGELAEGDTFALTSIYSTPDYNVGNYEIDFTFDITDQNGNSVLNNYDVTFTKGNFEIYKRSITVQNPSFSVEYSGKDNIIYHYIEELKGYPSDLPFTFVSGSIADGETHSGTYQDTSKYENLAVGTYENDRKIQIRNSNYYDTTNNYDITYAESTITVTQRHISLKTQSDTFYFQEGQEYYNSRVDVTNGSLANGDRIVPKNYPVVSELGVYENKMDITFLNSKGEDVSNCYAIDKITYGKLFVTDENGNTGTIDPDDPNPDNPGGEDPENPGETDPDNPGETDPVDPEEPDNPDPEKPDNPDPEEPDNPDPEKPENPDEPDPEEPEEQPATGVDTIVDLTGGIQGNGYGDDNKTPLLSIYNYGTEGSYLYLMQNFYDEYTENGNLRKAQSYAFNSGEANSNNYLYNLLAYNSSVGTSAKNFNINLHYLADFKKPLMPSYSNQVSTSSAHYDDYLGPAVSKDTSMYYYIMDYRFLSDANFIYLNVYPGNNSGSDAYAEYVKANYMDVPNNLKAAIEKIIQEENLKVNGDEQKTIANVVQYVKQNNVYDLKQEYAANRDIILDFLTKTHKGICSHFATSTAMMLRTIGIPARVVGGFAGELKGNNVTNFSASNAHAWTEVFISKFKSWIRIDSTPAGANGDGYGDYEDKPDEPQDPSEGEEDPDNPGETDPDNPENPDEPGGEDPDDPNNPGGGENPGGGTGDEGDGDDEPTEPSNPGASFPRDPVTSKITVSSKDLTFDYTSEENDLTKDEYYEIEGEPLEYDEIRITPTVQAIDAGKYKFKFNVTIVDTRNGVDVTKEYKDKKMLSQEYGNITVNKVDLDVYSRSKSKSYDGFALTGSDSDIYFDENNNPLQKNDKIIVVFMGSVTEVGQSKQNFFKVKAIQRPGNKNSKKNYDKITLHFGTLSIV